MHSFQTMLQAIGRSYTIGNIRYTLAHLFGAETHRVAVCVLVGHPEFVVAAALARAQVGE